MTIYMMRVGLRGQETLLEKLGKHKKSVDYLYVKKLADIDLKVLEQMVIKPIAMFKKRYAKYN